MVMYRNDSSLTRNCVDASTSSWHIPVSIGSSIGALLALSIIVLIVLLSRCPSMVGHPRPSNSESSKYDSMTSSRYHDDQSDTTTHCHDHDDDVFSDSCDSHPLDSGRYCHHNHHHHSHRPHPFRDRVCNGNKNHAFTGSSVGAGAGAGAAGGVVPLRHAQRTHSLGACGRSNSLERRTHSLERPRPHHSRRSRLMQLHSAHQSIQSEPATPGAHSNPSLPRPLHVSISDLPPAVHISDPDAPVSSLVGGASGGGGVGGAVGGATGPSVPMGGARAKTSLKCTPRTFHMSIDYDV